MKKSSIAVLLLILHGSLLAQHEEEAKHHDAHGMKGNHRLTAGLGHAHLSEGKEEAGGRTKWLICGSWSLGYDYWLTDKWAVGLQTEMILESFIIESSDKELIERNYPWSVVPVAIFKPGKKIGFIAGAGYEFAGNKNIALLRLGLEAGWHLPNNWEAGVELTWDDKFNYYNSWSLAFTFSRIFTHKKS